MHKLHKARCELKNRSAKTKTELPPTVFCLFCKNCRKTLKYSTFVEIGLSEETSFWDLL
jgi:RNase P subunit RPR2